MKEGDRKSRNIDFVRTHHGGGGGGGGGHGNYGGYGGYNGYNGYGNNHYGGYGGYGGYGHGVGNYGHGYGNYGHGYGNSGHGYESFPFGGNYGHYHNGLYGGYGGNYGHGYGNYGHHGRGFDLPEFDQRFLSDPFFGYPEGPVSPLERGVYKPIQSEVQIPVSVISDPRQPPFIGFPFKQTFDKKTLDKSKKDEVLGGKKEADKAKEDKKECTCKEKVEKPEKVEKVQKKTEEKED